MGKFVFDTMRGIDFLMQRDDVSTADISVAGNSLGGAVAGWVAAFIATARVAIIAPTQGPSGRLRGIRGGLGEAAAGGASLGVARGGVDAGEADGLAADDFEA